MTHWNSVRSEKRHGVRGGDWISQRAEEIRNMTTNLKTAACVVVRRSHHSSYRLWSYFHSYYYSNYKKSGGKSVRSPACTESLWRRTLDFAV